MMACQTEGMVALTQEESPVSATWEMKGLSKDPHMLGVDNNHPVQSTISTDALKSNVLKINVSE